MTRHCVPRLFLIAALAFVMTSAGRALADAAPPPVPPGSSIESGYQPTQVQMVSETVIITILDDHADVEATFQMRNQGTAQEAFDVWFPLGWQPIDDVTPIKDFSAYVDGKSMVTKNATVPCAACKGVGSIWATWPAVFPVGQTVSLGVTYRLQPGSPFNGQYVDYDYVLATGAGWYGKIGNGTVIIRLPYKIDQYNLLYNKKFEASEDASALVWKFKDLEPTDQDDVHVVLLDPLIERAIVGGRRSVELNPSAGEAHWQLARALDKAAQSNSGVNGAGYSRQMAEEAVQEYQQAIGLQPNNGDIYADYASLLWSMEDQGGIPGQEVWDVLNSGLKADPTNQKLLELQSNLSHWSTQMVRNATSAAVYYLTQTPHPTQTATTAPPQRVLPYPTMTMPVSSSNVETSSGSLPLIAGAVIVLGIGIWLYSRAKPRAH